MLLFFSKLLAVFVYPVGLSCLLAGGAVLLTYLQKKKAAMISGLLSIFIIWFFSLPFFSHFLVRGLESKYDQPVQVPQASAIVLLGGFTRPAVPPRSTVEVNFFGDRLLYAARLFREKRAPFIVCTGGKITFLKDFPGTEATSMARLLGDLWGIDSTSIIIENKAQNTHDHGPRVRAVFEQRAMKKDIILVTSAMHMYRSVKVMKKFGFSIIPAPAGFWEESRPQIKLFSFFPSADALFASTTALHEYYGIAAYWIMGWL